MDPVTIAAIIGGGSLLGASGLNFWGQSSNLEYQKWAQRKTWKREDDAVQRRVNDLRAAGLSPTLAAGSSAATSSPISTQAPQVDPMTMMNLMKMKNDISYTQAQTRLADQQVNKTVADTAQSWETAATIEHNRGAAGSMPTTASDKYREGAKIIEAVKKPIQNYINNNTLRTNPLNTQKPGTGSW